MQVTQTLKKAEYWVNFRAECAAYIEQHLREAVIPIAPIITAYPKKAELFYILPKKEGGKPVYNVDAEFTLEERASILWHDTGIAYEWALAMVKLRSKTKPENISIAGWNNIQQALSILCTDECSVLKTIIAHNWTIAHIFGCDEKAPELAFHNMGLAMLLKDTDRLDNISDKAIMIRNSRGVITSYSRPNVNTKNNQVLIYELL